MTIAILNNVRAIPMYARVPHSELSIFVGVLASTSFALCNNKLATIVPNVFVFTEQVYN